MIKKNIIAGMNIHSIEKNDLIDELRISIQTSDKKHEYISITNTEAMYFGSINRIHFDYINKAKFSLCDGIGVKLAALFHGADINKYHGPDMMLDVFDLGQEFGWSHYFLGGKEGVAEQLKRIMNKKYPNSKIVGTYSPPFRELTSSEEQIMISKINKIKPDFLWVSLGLPKQENWILKYKDQLDVSILIGVGAAFDFHTGNVKRAPLLFQKIGLEWLYRTAFEPRLYIRQFRGFKFLARTLVNNESRF